MTQGRIEGVVELLQRLTVLCPHLPDRLVDAYCVICKKSALAARISTRRILSEKSIQRWTHDAKALGLITVEYASHQRGRSSPNRYRVNFAIVMRLLAPSPAGAIQSHPEADSRAPVPASAPIPASWDSGDGSDGNVSAEEGGRGWTRVDIVSTPGVDIVSTPKNVVIRKSAAPLPPTASVGQDGCAGLAADVELQTENPIAELLRDAGLAHWRTLGVEFARLDAHVVSAAIATYRANVSRLAGPGALVSFLRTGVWPRDGLIDPAQDALADERRAAKRRQAAREAACWELVRTARRRGDSEETIRAELDRRGLSDVYGGG